MGNDLVARLFSNRWLSSEIETLALRFLRDAHAGLTRFDQFRKSLDMVPTMRTKRLKALTEDGLLEKRPYSESPPREEYVLTEVGGDFLQVLMMIGAWAHRHCYEASELARYVDVETGGEGEPIGSMRSAAPVWEPGRSVKPRITAARCRSIAV
jgi:DNA-binding HxlR family transcriptional regulator